MAGDELFGELPGRNRKPIRRRLHSRACVSPSATSSFRCVETLEQKRATAQAVVEELKREVETVPEAGNKHVRAAKERAARERLERLEAAFADLKQKRQELKDKGGNGKKPKEPRASTTDADARAMKMADAGFRPAYNVQVASVAGEQIVIAIDVTNNGSDGGLMLPMLEQVQAQTGLAGPDGK